MPRAQRPKRWCTVMCHRAEAGEYCIYREKFKDCWFAHSEAELRCVQFATFGWCNNKSCDRIHDQSERDDANTVPRQWGEQPKKHLPQFARQLLNFGLPRELAALRPTSQQKLIEDRHRAVAVCRKYLKESSTHEKLHALQFVEELFTLIDLFAYSQYNVSVEDNHAGKYIIPVPGLAENRPSVLRGDRVHVYCYSTAEWYGGYVHFVNLDNLVVSLPWAPQSFRANVFFTYTRTQDLVRHNAINDSSVYLSATSFSSTRYADESMSLSPAASSTKRLTEEQLSVVTSFLSCARRGTLLWGPPGTGKTTTIVAAIVALVETADHLKKEPPRILVVTPSNEAADLIVERLVALAPSLWTGGDGKKLLRVNAMMRDVRSVSKEVLSHSTPDIGGGGFFLPSRAIMENATVLVTTMMTAGKVYASCVKGFDALVVDEGGHCTEAELMIACQAAGINACRVLIAGDHKQLGAMVRAVPCLEEGLGISPLERLMNDTTVPPSCKVMLTKNYRSHPSILHVVNAVYEDKLLAFCVPKAVFRTDGERSASLLLSDANRVQMGNDLPLLFVHHEEPESRIPESPSWQNVGEAHMIVSAAIQLMVSDNVDPKDIVILSPYRQQVKKIEQILYFMFLQNFPDRLVRNNRGKLEAPIASRTVEMYQGREARVVFVSTVRNQSAERVATDVLLSIGFLKQPQRANVAMSRARDAMFVFGNAMLLANDPLWLEYLKRFDSFKAIYNVPRRGYGSLGDLLATSKASVIAQQVELGADALSLGNVERPFEREAG